MIGEPGDSSASRRHKNGAPSALGNLVPSKANPWIGKEIGDPKIDLTDKRTRRDPRTDLEYNDQGVGQEVQRQVLQYYDEKYKDWFDVPVVDEYDVTSAADALRLRFDLE